jgi:hypothetical protein
MGLPIFLKLVDCLPAHLAKREQASDVTFPREMDEIASQPPRQTCAGTASQCRIYAEADKTLKRFVTCVRQLDRDAAVVWRLESNKGFEATEGGVLIG